MFELLRFDCSTRALQVMFYFLPDDDGDGQAEEDCATPPPSKFHIYIIPCLKAF